MPGRDLPSAPCVSNVPTYRTWSICVSSLIAQLRHLHRQAAHIGRGLAARARSRSCVPGDLLSGRVSIDPTPLTCVAGAVAYGPNGSIVSLRSIDSRTVLSVVEGLQDRPVGVFVFVHDAVYLVSATEHSDPSRRQDWLEICGKYDKNVIDARAGPTRSDLLRRIEADEREIVKVTTACDIDDVPEIEALLKTLAGPAPAFHVTRAIAFILELVPTGISKEAAIATLCETMGISMAQVLAFGDGSNDRGVRSRREAPADRADARGRRLRRCDEQCGRGDAAGGGAFLL